VLKFGLICEVDAAKGLAKVHFQDDDVPSGWLPMSVQKSLKDKWSFPFDVNEHVWCVMDEHCEYGVIGGAIYNEKDQPAGAGDGKLVIQFADNSAITYDRNSKTLSLQIKGDIQIVADEKVSVQCKEAEVTVTNTAKVKANEVNVEAQGNATVKAAAVKLDAPNVQATGNLSVTGAVTAGTVATGGLGASGGGSLNVTSPISVSNISASGDVVAGTVSLKNHKHTAPSGGGATTPPIP
jgi:phage baseplate assembly protein V